MGKQAVFHKPHESSKLKGLPSVFLLSRIKPNKFRLEARQYSRLMANQMASFQKSLNKVFAGRYILEQKVFTDVPITRKPPETRMGKGKGHFETLCCNILRGQSVIDVSGLIQRKSMRKLKSVSNKLPFSINVKKSTLWLT